MGLTALGFVPAAAGVIRLVQLGGGAEITPENARFVVAPVPVVLHIISSTLYALLGAFQFFSEFRVRNPVWHRRAGWLLFTCGLVSALSGMWMAQFYPRGTTPPASFDGPYLYVIRLIVGSMMALFLFLGLVAARRRDIPGHRAWMIRSYALGLGAGTQVFTHIPWFVVPEIQGELARTLSMGAGWGINLAFAELILHKKRSA